MVYCLSMKGLIRALVFFSIVVAIGLIGGGIYAASQYASYYHSRPPVLPPALSASSTAFTGDPAAPADAFSAYLARPKVLSSIDVSSWMMYESAAYAYGIQHPSDVVVSEQGTSTIFSFPAANYFHWPLLDAVKVTVTASEACPDILTPSNGPAQTFDVGGYGFERHAGTDVGAGQLYSEVAYDTRANGFCYHIDFLDHGTNGAGFYVSDQDLIGRYDAQHQADMAAVLDLFDAMLTSFRARDIKG